MGIGSQGRWSPYFDKSHPMRLHVPYARAIATILSGQSLSTEIDMSGYVAVQFVIPAGFPGSVLTFQSSLHGNADYQNVRYNGAELSVAVTAGTNVVMPPDLALALYPFIKIRSGTSGAASPVGADTDIEILGILP